MPFFRMRHGRHASRHVDANYDERAVMVRGRKREAAGAKAVIVSLQRGLTSMGPLRAAAALMRLNQRNGFDCPGCAWPEERGGRKLAEFCENGAKAVAEEAAKRVVTPEFFARHSIADLRSPGRRSEPNVLTLDAADERAGQVVGLTDGIDVWQTTVQFAHDGFELQLRHVTAETEMGTAAAKR